MSLTIAEKILTRTSGKKEVAAGDFVTAKPDIYMSHEGLAEVASILDSIGVKKIPYPDRVVALLDHKVPPPSIQAAEVAKKVRKFVKEYGIKNWHNWNAGICHQILAEKGHARPGLLIVGTDSHTTAGAFNSAARSEG